MGYLAFWQRTKRKFEEATGKKKPSETILGVFKKSTGLESACKDLDKAEDKHDLAALKKAHEAYSKVMYAYIKVVDEARSMLSPGASEQDKAYDDELAKLEWRLLDINRGAMSTIRLLMDWEEKAEEREKEMKERVKDAKKWAEVQKQIQKQEKEEQKQLLISGGMYMKRWKQTREEVEAAVEMSEGLAAAYKKANPAIEKAILEVNKAEDAKDWKVHEKGLKSFLDAIGIYWAAILKGMSNEELGDVELNKLRTRLQSIFECCRSLLDIRKDRQDALKEYVVTVKKEVKDATRQRELVEAVSETVEEDQEEIVYWSEE